MLRFIGREGWPKGLRTEAGTGTAAIDFHARLTLPSADVLIWEDVISVLLRSTDAGWRQTRQMAQNAPKAKWESPSSHVTHHSPLTREISEVAVSPEKVIQTTSSTSEQGLLSYHDTIQY